MSDSSPGLHFTYDVLTLPPGGDWLFVALRMVCVNRIFVGFHDFTLRGGVRVLGSMAVTVLLYALLFLLWFRVII